MKKFRIIMRGENLLIDNKKHGFFATRFVEAESPEAAEIKSIELVRNDPELKNAVQNLDFGPSKIVLEDFEELKDFDGVDVPGTGFTFYPEGVVEIDD